LFVLEFDLGLELRYLSLEATNQGSEALLFGFRTLLFCRDLIR
jgi:hypothetical protein